MPTRCPDNDLQGPLGPGLACPGPLQDLAVTPAPQALGLYQMGQARGRAGGNVVADVGRCRGDVPTASSLLRTSDVGVGEGWHSLQ